LQFHGVSTLEALEQVLGPGGAMEAAQAAKEAGQVRHIGVSSHSLEVALKMAPMGCFETLQFPFNFVTREPADELLPLAQAHDVGFIAMKPFAGGLLGDATLSIKYLLQFEGVVPDPGIELVSEMREIVGILEGDWALTPQEHQEIERIRAELGTRFCRRCEYCQPCPQEIPISTVMNLRSFAKRFPPERFFSGRFPETVEKARTCLECGECEERCPYHLPIREMLVENVAYYERIRP
jgi:predicted aldo/keto reductase-like oxidoreductase